MKDRSELELKRQEKIERQNKNLHGGERVEGLTGRWRGVFYERGVARPRKPNTIISPLSFWRDQQIDRRFNGKS